jgi:fructose PTS system EIIBC or EIIC component
MRIVELLSRDNICIPLQSTTKLEIIEELVNLLPYARANKANKKEALDAVLAREEIYSTGIGEGVAIPHAKMEIPIDIEMAFGMSPHGVDFDAIDGKPSQIYFLLIAGKNSGNLHLKILARISRLMHHEIWRTELLQCSTESQVLEFFEKSEKNDLK